MAQVLDAELAPAPEHVASELGLGPGDPVVRRRQLVTDNEEPVEMSTSWCDGRLAERGPRLLEVARIDGGTLAYLEKVTKRRAVSARDMLAARLASAEEKRTLVLEGSRPAVLVVQHTVRDTDGGALEVVEAVHPPDRWAFEQEYVIRS